MALARGLAALALLTPLLAGGCVAPRVGAESVTLTFACRNHEVLHYRSLIEAFQAEYPAITVRLASLEEIADRFPEHPAGDIGIVARAVDAFVGSAPGDTVPLDGVLLDLASYARRDGLSGDELFAGAANPFRRDDRLYGLPHQAHAYVLYYDPVAFEEAGLPPPRPGWTRDDMTRAALATTERAGSTTLRYGLVDRWPGYTIAALSGGTAEGGRAPELDPAELADHLLWYADLIKVHQAAPDPSAADAAEDNAALLMGERPPAMWTGHSFEAGRYRRRYGAEVAPLPQGEYPAPPITVDGYMVSAHTLYPEEAWRWIEFLSRQPSATYYGGIMVRRSAGYWGELDESTAASFRYCLQHGAVYGPDVWTPVQTALLGVLRGETLSQVMEREPWVSPPEGPQGASSQPSGGGTQPFLAAPPALALDLPETGANQTITIRFAVDGRQDEATYRMLADRLALERRDMRVEVVGPGAPADCFVAGAEVAREAPEGSLVPVDRFIPGSQLRSAYPTALVAPLRGGGHVWGLPLDADARVLVYHRGRFDAEGLSYPTKEWTARVMVEHAALLTDAAREPPLYGYWPRGGAALGAGETIAWLGGRLLDRDGRPTFDTPTAAAALERYLGLLALAPPDLESDGGALLWGSYPAPVEKGQVAMWLDGYASASRAAGRNPALGIAPLPRGAITPPPRLERALYVSARSPHPDECWEWLWYVSERAEAVSLLPARSALAGGDAWRWRVGDEVATVWRETLTRLEGEGDTWGPYSDGTTLRWVDEAVAEVLAGADPREALAQAQAQAEAYAECMTTDDAAIKSWEECVEVAEGVP